MSAGFGMVTGALSKILGGQFLTDLQTFVAALDTVFGGFRARAAADLRAAPGRRDGVPRDRGARSRTRCARRRTSSSGSARSGCRWPGWSSTGPRRRPRDRCRPTRRWRPPARLQKARPDGSLTAGLLRLHADRARMVEREAVAARAVRGRPPAGADGGGPGAGGRRARPGRAAKGRQYAGGRLKVTVVTSTGRELYALTRVQFPRQDGSVELCVVLAVRSGVDTVSVPWCGPPRGRSATRRSGGDGGAHGAHARSCRPTRPTRSGCRAPRRGTRSAPGIRCTSAWPCSARPRGRRARRAARSGTLRWGSSPRSTFLCSTDLREIAVASAAIGSRGLPPRE